MQEPVCPSVSLCYSAGWSHSPKHQQQPYQEGLNPLLLFGYNNPSRLQEGIIIFFKVNPLIPKWVNVVCCKIAILMVGEQHDGVFRVPICSKDRKASFFFYKICKYQIRVKGFLVKNWTKLFWHLVIQHFQIKIYYKIQSSENFLQKIYLSRYYMHFTPNLANFLSFSSFLSCYCMQFEYMNRHTIFVK